MRKIYVVFVAFKKVKSSIVHEIHITYHAEWNDYYMKEDSMSDRQSTLVKASIKPHTILYGFFKMLEDEKFYASCIITIHKIVNKTNIKHFS